MLNDKLPKSASKYEKYLILFLVAIIIYGIIQAFIYNNNFDKSIEEHKYTTVAKIIKFKYFSKGRSETHIEYYFKSKPYEIIKEIGRNTENKVNKYYVLDLSTENPKYSKIYLDQEITDTLEIIKAGFKLDEPK